MKIDAARYAPPGINYSRELKWIAAALIASVIYSLGFLIFYIENYRDLFWEQDAEKGIIKGAMMPDFIELLNYRLFGFAIIALCMLAVSLYHYLYHYQGSKSIYLMKRLPNRFELWRRCLALPLGAALFSLVTAMILMLIYFGIYLFFTPEICLAPNQWEKIGSVVLGVAL